MRRLFCLITAICFACATLVISPSAAGAELESSATTSWGVSGLVTGSKSDTINSEVWAIEQIGNRIYVGGRFTHVTNGATSIDQPFLAAFDATTGVYLPDFAPDLNNAVFALEAAPDGSRLFVGGSFSRVDGSYTGALVALDPIDGSRDSWSGRVGGTNLVRNLALLDNHLYASGSFGSMQSSAGSSTAYGVARFDWQSGVHDSAWRPVVGGGSVWGVAPSATADRVYLAGYFSSVNGSNASGGFKAVTKSTGENASGVQDMKVNTTTTSRQYSYDVVTTNGLVFVAGSEHSVQVLNESNLSLRKFHISRVRGDYQDLEVIGDRVYAGCHCRQGSELQSANGVLWYGRPPWFQSSAPITSRGPNSWATAFEASTGDHIGSFVPNINSNGAGIWALHGGADGCLWLGGNITKTGGARQYGITRICDPANGGGPGAPTDTARPTNPGRPRIQATGPASVDLAWFASSDDVGVAGYRLINIDTGQVMLDTPSTSGTISGLLAGTYRIYTKAYDAAGNVSYRSGVTEVTITGNGGAPDTERPSAPRGLMTDGTSTTATLTWTPSTDNLAVAGYYVFDQGSGQVVADVSSPTADITLPPGTYTFAVKAYDAAGNTSWRSNQKSYVFG